MQKKSWFLILMLASTIILGIIAVTTAYKLYQLRNVPIAPTAPESVPAADDEQIAVPECTLEFTVSELSPTPTSTGTITPTSTGTPGPTSTPTPTSTSTPTPTSTPTCTPTGTPMPTSTPRPTSTPEPTGVPTSTPTTAPQATSTPRPTSTCQPTSTPVYVAEAIPTQALPEAGFTLPTWMMVLGGIGFILFGLLFAF